MNDAVGAMNGTGGGNGVGGGARQKRFKTKDGLLWSGVPDDHDEPAIRSFDELSIEKDRTVLP